MNKRSCSKCEWWDQRDEYLVLNGRGICRVNPPILDPRIVGLGGFWPETFTVDWCAEFDQAGSSNERRRPRKVPAEL